MYLKGIVYTHLVRFVPKNETLDTASEVKQIPVQTDEQYPTESESIAEAKRNLQKLMDPYTARNHWEAYDVITSYANPPWHTHPRLRSAINLFAWSSGVLTKRGNDEISHVVTHDSNMTENDILNYLRKFYGASSLDLHTVSFDDQTTAIYVQWRTNLKQKSKVRTEAS